MVTDIVVGIEMAQVAHFGGFSVESRECSLARDLL